jgi:hypothetical protein
VSIELALQLRPEAFIDLVGKPVFDLSVRQRGLDLQQTVIADEPVGTASDRARVIGDEAHLLDGDVVIEFIPIGRLGLDDDAAFHRRRMIKLDFPLQDPLGNQQAGVFTPLFRRFPLRCDDLVEIGARRDPELEAVIRFGILRHVMKDWHEGPRP